MNDLVSLRALFDNKIFRIPDYQRGYAWEKSQLNDFWDDIIYLPENKIHYTGMISLLKVDNDVFNKWDDVRWIINEKGFEPYHVVDGQQRLTTFVIFINSILQYAEKHNIEYVNGDSLETIKNRYIVETKKPKNLLKAYKFGYENDNPSYEFLKYIILSEEKSGSIDETFYTINLENAKKFFDEKLEMYKDINNMQSFIDSLYKKVSNLMCFNIHYIDNSTDAYVAFETMNNRGKKLSNLEILKNRLIYLTTIYPDDILPIEEKKEIRNKINNAWKEVYFQLGRNKNKPLNDDEYLKNHWTLYFKYTRNKGDDYIKFLLNQYFSSKSVYGIARTYTVENEEFDENEEILNEYISYENSDYLQPDDIVSYVKSLEISAQYWYYSFNPYVCNSITKEEQIWIDKLNRIGINYFRTLVVASYLNDTITSEKRIELFKVIEKFIFLCFRLQKYQSNYNSQVSYRYARLLMKKEIDINDVIKYFDDAFKANIKDACNSFLNQMNNHFKNEEGYYSWHILKYFLFEYELYLSKNTFITKLDDWNAFVKNEKDKISIEHIYPQTPTKWYWRNRFRDYDEYEQKCLTNSLGNLLALSQSINSSLQNDEFELKKNPTNERKRGYTNGSNSEIEVSKYSDWTPITILNRGLKLLEFMENRWQFKIDEDIKYDLLGLSFMKKEREISEELPKDDFTDRDFINEENNEKLSIYLKDKNNELVYVYQKIYESLKTLIPDLYEVTTKDYIAFRNKLNKNLAELSIMKKKIKIYIKKPKSSSNLGKFVPENYNYTLNYRIYVHKYDEVDKIVNEIYMSYTEHFD